MKKKEKFISPISTQFENVMKIFIACNCVSKFLVGRPALHELTAGYLQHRNN